jgi:5-(carboxyamino)imidazole ribonucleotide mutase
MKEKIAIVLGSKSDLPKIKEGIDLLEGLSVNYSLDIVSAHRNPEKLRKLTLSFKRKGIEAIIAAAGMAAALPGFIASYTDIPVIGVALDGGLLGGLDALFSITGSPKGLGLVASGVGKSAFINAVIFSLEILALGDKKYTLKLKALKSKFK